MNVLEIKNNLVKIAYEVKDDLALSGFVIIEDENSPYIAQIINVKADASNNFAIAKLLFTFNTDGILKNYNGTIPSLKSKISSLPTNELLDIIPVESPILLGEVAQQNTKLNVDKTVFENNLLICSNNFENTTILINNFLKQINEKSVIIDTEGQFENTNKITFGKDFKLPLNYETINFIYDNDLDDVDATSKAVIQDIFIEVQEYTKSLPEGYIPFETFIDVVDQQYRETQIPQLILLKNKLLKYRDNNVFAENLKDILNLSIAIEKQGNTIINISDTENNLQKEVISYIYDVMKGIKENIYAFAKINNTNTDKKLLKKLIQRENIFTTIICPHEYKYINELKEIAQNIIFFKPLTLQHDFASYNTFLNKLNNDEFVIYGAHTQNIPLIITLTDLEEDNELNSDNNEINIENSISDNTNEKIENAVDNSDEENTKIHSDNIQIEETKIINKDTEINSNLDIPQEKQTINTSDISEDPYSQIEINDKTDEPTTYNNEKEFENIDNSLPISENIQIVENIENTEIEEEENNEDEKSMGENSEIINILQDENNEIIIEENLDNNEDNDTNIEEPAIDYSLDDIDISNDNDFHDPVFETQNNDELIEQVSKDVDRVMYEKIPEENNVSLEEINNYEVDELTEDDLNLIDNLAGENIELNKEEPLINDNEIENSTPVIPIYSADNENNINTQTFEPGEKVSTPKYGEGIVEKMIKYGNKMLCSIEFPNVGRRLLDPTMTEITKLD